MVNLPKHRVAITLRVTNAPNYDEKRDAISHDLINFVSKINCLPILLSNKLENVKEFLDEFRTNAIILSGGDNIRDNPERDRIENDLITYSISNKIPLIGICRGMQVLNNYFEGSLDKVETKHVKMDHSINIVDDSFTSIFGSQPKVNSFHNNIIPLTKLGKNLHSFAMSNQDDTVEGFFHNVYPIVGIMWHPEREEKPFDEILCKRLFQEGIFWNK